MKIVNQFRTYYLQGLKGKDYREHTTIQQQNEQSVSVKVERSRTRRYESDL